MTPEQRRAQEAFLVDNDELVALNARLGRLNILQVLGCARMEIRHSNVLAWLLDPSGGHGLGDLFLRRFLARILMGNEGVGASLTAARVELDPVSFVDVRREWRNCDVLVHHPEGGWCLLIENKIRSGERKGQLERYRQAVHAEFPSAEVIPVLLSLDGVEPSAAASDAGWVPFSYGEVVDVVERLTQQRRSQIPGDALVLLEHWIEALRRLTMSDPDLVELCRRIYRKHRAAIDLIVDHGISSGVLDACLEYVRSLDGLAFEPVVRGSRVWFMPKALADSQRAVTPGWQMLPASYPVCFWLDHRRKHGRLKVGLEVGRVADTEMRHALLQAFKDEGFKFQEKGAFRDDARFTRVWTKSTLLPKGSDDEVVDDPDAIASVARRLWAAAEPVTERALLAMRSVSWQ